MCAPEGSTVTGKEKRKMAERPHSRKVTIGEGTVEVKKGEKISEDMRASERTSSDADKKQEKEED